MRWLGTPRHSVGRVRPLVLTWYFLAHAANSGSNSLAITLDIVEQPPARRAPRMGGGRGSQLGCRRKNRVVAAWEDGREPGDPGFRLRTPREPFTFYPKRLEDDYERVAKNFPRVRIHSSLAPR